PEHTQPATTGATLMTAASGKRRRTQLLLLVCGLAIIGGAAAFSWYKLSRNGKNAGTKQLMRIIRVTNSGRVGGATISPDGKFIAYVENYPTGDGTIWVKQVATNSEAQLLPSGERTFGGTAFSKDSAYIYYTLYDKNDPQGALYRVPVLGGPT